MNARYGFRFGRLGTAVVLITMPITLPAFALAAGLVEAWAVIEETIATLPAAVLYAVRGRP
jgi:hypothetical protein